MDPRSAFFALTGDYNAYYSNFGSQGGITPVVSYRVQRSAAAAHYALDLHLCIGLIRKPPKYCVTDHPETLHWTFVLLYYPYFMYTCGLFFQFYGYHWQHSRGSRRALCNWATERKPYTIRAVAERVIKLFMAMVSLVKKARSVPLSPLITLAGNARRINVASSSVYWPRFCFCQNQQGPGVLHLGSPVLQSQVLPQTAFRRFCTRVCTRNRH